jgi:hypothetical protein
MNVSNQRIFIVSIIAALLLIVGSSLKTHPVTRVSGLRAVVFADETTACDQRTVLGAYGFQGQGTLGLGTPQPTLAAETGVATADGVGNLSGNVTFSLGGQILSTPFTGTYQVNADCTISETIAFGTQTRHQQGVIVSRGQQIDFIDTDPGTVLTRVARRVQGGQF